MNIPWKLKSFCFEGLSQMPEGTLYFIQRHITGRSKINIKELAEGWKFHAAVAGDIKANSLIEFGAGKSIVQNLYLSSIIDSQVVVDLFPMLDFSMINDAISQLSALGVKINGKPVETLDDLRESYGIEYRSPFDMRDTDFPDNHFDMCVSTNTLEHIPKQDIEQIFKELYRIIKPDGIVSAMIDYSDHYAHTDRSIGRLNYLQYSDKEWQRYNHTNHYQNRLRHQHYKDIFLNSGFKVKYDVAINVCSSAEMAVRAELLTGNDTDYSTTGFWKLNL